MPGDFEQGLAKKEHYPGIFLRPELPVDGQTEQVAAEARPRSRSPERRKPAAQDVHATLSSR